MYCECGIRRHGPQWSTHQFAVRPVRTEVLSSVHAHKVTLLVCKVPKCTSYKNEEGREVGNRMHCRTMYSVQHSRFDQPVVQSSSADSMSHSRHTSISSQLSAACILPLGVHSTVSPRLWTQHLLFRGRAEVAVSTDQHPKIRDSGGGQARVSLIARPAGQLPLHLDSWRSLSRFPRTDHSE
jgi:hypothetical protein